MVIASLQATLEFAQREVAAVDTGKNGASFKRQCSIRHALPFRQCRTLEGANKLSTRCQVDCCPPRLSLSQLLPDAVYDTMPHTVTM